MAWIFSKRLIANSHCLPVGGAESSEAKYSDGAPLEPWKLKSIHVGYSCSDKTTVRSILSRYGRTLEASPSETMNAGHISDTYSESLIDLLFPEAFHVKIYRWLVKVQVLMGKIQDSGGNISGWFAKYDPQECMWKTPQCSLLGESTEYLKTWPKWGIMLHGECLELPTLELTTTGKGSGYWPTPTKSDYKGGSDNHNRVLREKSPSLLMYFLHKNFRSGKTSYPNPILLEVVMGWPLGWTELKPSETDKYLQQWQEHFQY